MISCVSLWLHSIIANYGNKDGFLSLDFGLTSVRGQGKKQRLALYRQYVYEKGSLGTNKGKAIDRFRYRTRYFSDSGIIGSKEFVRRCWQKLCTEGDYREKRILPVAGLDGIYSLKRLSEKILKRNNLAGLELGP